MRIAEGADLNMVQKDPNRNEWKMPLERLLVEGELLSLALFRTSPFSRASLLRTLLLVQRFAPLYIDIESFLCESGLITLATNPLLLRREERNAILLQRARERKGHRSYRTADVAYCHR